jgi:L-alanine-DL-glutamate epimerase-like enolase superfamily enzyme
MASVLRDLAEVRHNLETGVDDLTPRTTPAMAALTCAMLDAFSKSTDMPLWRALSAEGPRAVACNATLIAGTPDEVAADAERWAADGFAVFKLKVGTGNEPEMVSAVRRAVGDDAQIRLDANGAWGVEEAISLLKRIDPLGIELVEQPVADLAGMSQVAERTEIPLVADESVATVDEAARAVEMKACAAATIKLSKVGGALVAQEMAKVLPAYLSSALDGPVGIAAAAHLACLLPDHGYAHGLATERLFADTIAAKSVPLEGSKLIPGSEPGLGVEIDEGALARLRIDVS